MTAVVSIKHPEPRFEGQTKTKLDNQDAARATGKVMSEQLVLYFDRNLETLKTILSCAEKAAKIRKTEERAKTNLLTKQKYCCKSPVHSHGIHWCTEMQLPPGFRPLPLSGTLAREELLNYGSDL